MKRFLTILVLLTYFTVTSGFAVSLHYCMDELSGIEIGSAEGEECPRCGMDVDTAPGGCCRDEVKLVQHKGDTPAVASLNYAIAPLTAEAPAPSTYLPLFQGAQVAAPTIPIRPPPPLGESARYLVISVFRL